MARIRSVHPSLFTDEAWVSCSAMARMLYIGLLCEADDQGLFEWKLLQIKMRLLPADNADVAALLEELRAANLIAPLESAGKRLGAIRRFCKFQRPKKPTAHFTLPPEWRTYVGIKADGSEPADDDDGGGGELGPPEQPPVPPKSELAEQKEDGGGRREEIDSDPDGSAATAAPDDLEHLRAKDPKSGAWALALRVLMDRGGYPQARARPIVGKWMKDHPPAEVWQACEAAWKIGTLDPVSYITEALKGIRARADGDFDPMLQPEEWRQRKWMEEFVEGKFQWSPQRGPGPGEPGCRVAPEIQREFGVDPAAPQPVRGAA